MGVAHELRQGLGDPGLLEEDITRLLPARSKAEVFRRHARAVDAVDMVVRTLSWVSSFPVFARSVGRASNTR
jgi:hypothetical protein